MMRNLLALISFCRLNKGLWGNLVRDARDDRYKAVWNYAKKKSNRKLQWVEGGAVNTRLSFSDMAAGIRTGRGIKLPFKKKVKHLMKRSRLSVLIVGQSR